LAVITDADVVTCSRGISVRVEVTKTGGKIGSGGSAAGDLEKQNKTTNKKSKQTFIKPSFSRERGMLGSRIGLLARALS
jgi:phage baseplate assembly protein gpV